MMNEQQLEDLCIGWFQETGWQFARGLDIAPEGSSPERADYRQVVLRDRLLRCAHWRESIRSFRPARWIKQFTPC